MLSCLEVLKEQVNCCLPAFLVLVTWCRVLGEGLEQEGSSTAAQRAAVQGWGSTESHMGVCDRAEESGATSASDRAKPVGLKASHC